MHSAWSLNCSADKRTLAPLANHLLYGSSFSCSGVILESCRYVALVTIIRSNFFMLQLSSCINRWLNQSSNSGWVGGIPCDPRSSNVSARPLPKSCSQTRFTMVRAVKGFCFEVSHIARPNLLRGALAGKGFND